MKLQLKKSLTLDTDQVSCSEEAKSFIEYAFSLNGPDVKPNFESAMMRFVHALEDVVRMGKLKSDDDSIEFTVDCVPEAIAALAEAYPTLAVRQQFANWFNCTSRMHRAYLPEPNKYSELARVAVCWWDERLIHSKTRHEATADNVDELLQRVVVNREKVDAAYVEFLDKFAAHIDNVLRDARFCAIHSRVDWLREMVDELDEKLDELGECSGGTRFMTEEIMKVTHTRVLVTERDCEYCEILPGKYLVGDYGDSDIFRACARAEYGCFIDYQDFTSNK